MGDLPGTMRTLYLVRHAKSSWKHPELEDIDRPLSKRGRRDAPFMGRLLREMGVKPDRLLASQAKRAVKTAEAFAAELGYPKKDITQDDMLYGADAEGLLQVVRTLADGIQTVMLFGHNPGLLDVAILLTGGRLAKFPTAAVACLELDVASWSETGPAVATLRFFEYPKKHQR